MHDDERPDPSDLSENELGAEIDEIMSTALAHGTDIADTHRLKDLLKESHTRSPDSALEQGDEE